MTTTVGIIPMSRIVVMFIVAIKQISADKKTGCRFLGSPLLLWHRCGYFSRTQRTDIPLAVLICKSARRPLVVTSALLNQKAKAVPSAVQL